ncbi:hypothetical protein PM082_008505 [Marasmius tenuissimus]|nr:hypothetical protein PM082_008505 [Marasmius tenuissimus]
MSTLNQPSKVAAAGRAPNANEWFVAVGEWVEDSLGRKGFESEHSREGPSRSCFRTATDRDLPHHWIRHRSP